MTQRYGYVRVSTREQNETRQLAALKCCDIPARNMYQDKLSGKDFRRPAYQRMLRRIKAGDVLFVHSIDRLGRNYDEILEQWRFITREKEADIVVLDFPLLDTRAKMDGQDLTGRFVSTLILQILAYVAQKERENIRERQAQGIAAAKAAGRSWGKPSKHLPEGFDALYRQYKAGKLNQQEMLTRCGMARSTFYKRLKEYRADPQQCMKV